MPLPAQKFREMVFQMLYADDFSQGEEADVVELLMHELKVTKKAAREAHAKVVAIREKLSEIDDRIRPASTEYQFERISRVEKNVLRLGIYELCYDDSLPPKVAISEAIRLCRKFGTPESAQFVNAILDVIYKGFPCPSKSDSEPVNL
ncbi:MAG: nusB [Parachlamydiales bacterium]|nr:nusB [Parachlamydiales bacterium]